MKLSENTEDDFEVAFAQLSNELCEVKPQCPPQVDGVAFLRHTATTENMEDSAMTRMLTNLRETRPIWDYDSLPKTGHQLLKVRNST